ncbi:hypothetical protein TWF788_007614 [Orbilia oligospora]|uniref:Uncharacterized protein n=1 Tax=Orbilia oligospora TaxID=2813651 RepID=A0A6G1LQW1_ORBOL|nr:hypothetical protein TWF788_007614 [Orbilia oligospora]KAF3208080.1 hypothetical protein TWF191_000902 [Orbilia oligospora]KAF3210870.1 hypothetical protein TWF679_006658 [Orbilia oligospora]KAF3231199.1 hypothetical protein TWF192_003670 [Orbilia oligospora]
MHFIKQAVAATIFVFSFQTTLVAGQSASLVRSYIKTEKKLAENLSPLVDNLDYHLQGEEWTPVFDRVVAGLDSLTRGVRLAERRFSPKLPKFDEKDTKDIEKDFLSFADEAIDALATFTRKTRPAVNTKDERFETALKPLIGLEKSLKNYLPKLLETIPSASESVQVSMQLLQDSVGGLVLIFDEVTTSEREEAIIVDSHRYRGSGSVRIIIE